ncbi:beta strand repeat-containing protein [Roseivirga misakiensis]|nr:Calx-beta domain-containing protein [Roseivirga misakiensis]
MSGLSPATVAGGDIDITDGATLTLTNDDNATVTIANVSGNEDDGAITVTVTLDNAVDGGFDVDVSTADGTATTADSDYIAVTNQTLTFAGTAGETETFTVTPTADVNSESNETVSISMSNKSPASVASANIDITDGATVTIINDDDISASINDPSVSEGDAGSATLTFTVSLDSPAPSGGATVDYATSDGTASSASDYTSTTGTVSFSAGETSKTIDVTVAGENMVETDETITMTLSNPTGTSVVIGDATGTGTINNDDTTVVTIANVSANENSGAQTITATLTNPVQGGFAFDVFTTDGTATVADSDYSSTAGSTLTFVGTAGETQTLNLQGLGDMKVEANETFTMSMTNVGFTSVDTNDIDVSSVATYTILNDDSATVTIANVAVNENDGTATITLTLDNAVDGGFDVDVSTADNTATTADGDYTAVTSATETFAGTASETETFTITIGGDTKVEADELVDIAMSNLVPTTVDASDIDITDAAQLTLTNDDAATVAFNATASSGSEATASTNLQVDLSTSSDFTITVDYTVTGTATGAGTDYTLDNGTLTFTPGDVSENITIASIVDDVLDEVDETVIVTLSNPSNATLGTNTIHTYTITDDDDSPIVQSSPDGLVNVSTGGNSFLLVFTKDISFGTGQVELVDVTDNSNSFSFDVESSSDISISGATLKITPPTALDASTNYAIKVDATAIDDTDGNSFAGIIDNTTVDFTTAEATLSFSQISLTTTESATPSTLNLPVTLYTPGSGVDVMIDYTVTGTATSGEDYDLTSGTLTISAGNRTNDIITEILDDLLDEDDETVIITLSNPVNATLASPNVFTYTIQDDDDAPTVTLSVDNSTIAENGGTSTLTATLSEVSGKDVTVTLGYSGTTTNGTDYNSSAGTSIVITAGTMSNTASPIVTSSDDTTPEGNETVIVDVTNVANGTEATTQTQTITITDDDTPNMTFTGATSNGAETVSSADITVDLSIASLLTVTADYAITGTATNGSDFTLAGGTLTFAPSETQKTITIAGIVDDAILESNETVIVTLSNLSNANAGTNQVHTYTINDNDAAAVTIADVSQAENGGDITVTATLDNAVQGGFTVDISSADGTAEAGDDYTAITSQTLTFSGTAGEMQTFTITPTADTKLEADETLTVSQGNLGATSLSIDISDGATVTINNDDNAAVTIEDVSGAENGGAITLTATLDNAVQGGFSVDVVSTDNTATTADSDYTALIGTTLTFTGTAGETQQFSVTPIADTKVEANESLFLGMQNIQGTTLTINNGDGALVTINNDDAATLAIDDVTMNEGASGTATYTFTTTLTGDLDQAFTVDYATQDGTATTADSDYTAATGTLNFAGTNGETQSFSVSVNGDDKVELDEAFSVLLSNLQAGGKNLTITDDTGAGTLTNDDNAVVTIADISQAENGGDITVTAILDNAVQGGFTLDVNTTDGTATAGSDYTAVTSQTLTFVGTAGEMQTFTISPTADAIVEADENLTVSMGNLANTGVTVDISDGATISITNDDEAIFTITDANSNENGSGNEDDGAITMVITLDKAVDIGFDVRVRSQASSATEGTDYTVLDETLTFSGTVGETKTFTVIPTADQILEADEVLDVGIFSTTLDNNVRDRNIDDQATVTITNDDAASLAITDVTIAEGNSGITTFTFDVTLTGAVDQQVMVDYTTADGTATTADSDYTAASGTLTFNGTDGEVQQITVDITGDMTEESDEDFTVTLSNVADGNKGVTIATATGTGILTNEDDNTAPSGYSVNFDDNLIISTELTSSTITMAGAEVGTTYNFTISSAGGGTNVTGTGTIATATDQITLGDLTGLGDGTLTISLELTDGFSNTGSAVTGTTEKKAIIVDPVLSPADDAVDILPSSDLTMTFGENMNKGTGDIVIKRMSDDVVLETIDVTSSKVSISGSNVTINPDNLILPPFTTFYVTIDAGVFTDDAGNDYAGISNNTDWSFTTIAASVVDNVDVPTADTYAIGDALDFTVNMVLPVTITGTATLPVTIGSKTVNATQVGSVNNSTSIVFRYTVVEDDLDADGISLDAPMELNGGTMRDEFGVDAILSLNNTASLATVLVDGVRPVPTLSTTGVELTNTAFTTTFSYDKQVEGFALADITVTNGTADNFTEVIAGSVWSADITPEADGTVTVSLAAGVASDIPGNASAASNTVSKVFDGTAPTVTSITRKEADQLNTNTSTANFTVLFSESVSGVDLADFEISLSGATAALNTVTAIDSKTYEVNVNGISGEGTIGINLKDDDTILDDALNSLGGTGIGNADFTSGEIYTTNFAPTDITTTGTISENNLIGDVARELASTDDDTGDNHTYTLVAGDGADDNGSFTIDGNQLKAAEVFDFEVRSSYSVRVKTDDGFGGEIEKALDITIENVLEPSVFIVEDETVFDVSALGRSQQRTITITNDGEIPVEVRSAGNTVPGFEVLTGSVQIPVGQSVPVVIAFIPTEARNYSGIITFNYTFQQEGRNPESITIGHSVSGAGAIITSVDNGTIDPSNISIYPNPADRILTIDLSELAATKLDIEIVNATGIKLYGVQDYTDKELRLDVSRYEMGIYIIQFTNGTSVVRKKVMIKR